MPNLDGTGPNSQGPRTGRGLGNCPGTGGTYQNMGRGQGMGQGRKNRRFKFFPFYQSKQDLVENKNQDSADNKKSDKQDSE